MSPDPRYKVVSIWQEGSQSEHRWQFALALGEVITIGRAQDCQVCLQSRSVSSRHAELSLVEVEASPPPVAADNAGAHDPEATAAVAKQDKVLELVLKDVSTNGTGVAAASSSWTAVRNSCKKTLGAISSLLLPYNRKTNDSGLVLSIQSLGDSLPDARDDRKGTGRWRYHSKLGEGGLGIVFRAEDTSGCLKGEVAVKVSKIPKSAKPGARLRHAYILHRECQWSMKRLHNPSWQRYDPSRAIFFVKYLEDHTGCWAPDLDFEEERTVFEASDFLWDTFRNGLHTFPYVVLEIVPGITLHQRLSLSTVPAEEGGKSLPREKKVIIAKQMIQAIKYFSEFGLIHRDFRTTNIMVLHDEEEKAGKTQQNAPCIRVIDLGHTIASEPEQIRNRSAVVRCNWRESKQKHFEWAPPEVKYKQVNFCPPCFSFDVYSLAVLFMQLEMRDFAKARETCTRLSKQDASACKSGALSLPTSFLMRMLGRPWDRPPPQKVWEALENPSLAESILASLPVAPRTQTADRSRSRSPRHTNGKLDRSTNGVTDHNGHGTNGKASAGSKGAKDAAADVNTADEDDAAGFDLAGLSETSPQPTTPISSDDFEE
mmetsp:Transcript_35065/g.74579  ORF Transcript_35065/g.74579 Transcript_35065/m.74579 type:complete len:599 (-) Transcript_35065:21-1817(-)|eukprot:CAMPEP_0206425346 /NCGR_PEP_ID=MMETSP0324_2-20121206/3739_1 /ASSEMBLY_ACC=CAM_ASM_000836 /TAXON_ID=2866 /ORGANISM="Crypthecodinium cohnii, Strain Seligo" /LENGTH=598 /DNA_ID=CAMNT_0053890115 /DNA_START=158 /DNA_END=1954 /DNA_ORIENTATION=+